MMFATNRKSKMPYTMVEFDVRDSAGNYCGCIELMNNYGKWLPVAIIGKVPENGFSTLECAVKWIDDVTRESGLKPPYVNRNINNFSESRQCRGGIRL